MKKSIQKVIALFLSLSFLLIPLSLAKAETISDLNKQKDYYSSQAEQARKQAEQKQQQADQLANQINVVSDQISSTESSLASTDRQITATTEAVNDLENKIADQEDQLAVEEEKMGKVLSSWYMEGESGLLESLIGADNLSEVINHQEYYESVRQQVEGQIESIENIKAELTADKTDKDRQLAALNDLKSSQEGQMSYLETRKVMKNRLLSDTKNAISDLQEEEQSAQQMIAQLQVKIDRIRAMGQSGTEIVSVSDSWYYSQLDSRWSGVKMGNYATIGMYGCLITSLTMIAKFYGDNITPADAVEQSAFVHGGYNDGALIRTSIVSDGGSQSINWDTVDRELSNGRPVVAGVALGVDMGNSYGVSHFIVLKSKLGTNKYAMLDPLGEGRKYNMSQVKAMRIIRPN